VEIIISRFFYIVNIFTTWGGENISRCYLGGKYMKSGKRKKEENVKEKGEDD
jgi:hypothetical protein